MLSSLPLPSQGDYVGEKIFPFFIFFRETLTYTPKSEKISFDIIK